MILKDQKKYDGKIIHKRFAFEYLLDNCNPLGDVIIFRGEMEVLADTMIDQEDLMAEAFIWSEDALNIVWEMPILGNNPFAAVAYQHLFNQKIVDLLSKKHFLNKNVILQGDDIMVQGSDDDYKKASVSITHVKNNVALGHTGINIFAGAKAPEFAYSTKLNEQQVQQFSEEIEKTFYTMNKHLFVATSKVLS